MTAALSNKSRAEPNLTPMLDLVFQLITFFMLVINFKSNMIDRRMQLPVVGTARPMQKEDRRTFMMVNLNDKGEFTVLGRPLKDDREIRDYILRQAETDRLTARRRDPNFPEGGELDTWVIIRADKSTPFNKLYKIIKLCRDEGYRNFAFRALTPAEAAKAQRGAAYSDSVNCDSVNCDSVNCGSVRKINDGQAQLIRRS